jgi:methionyl-tRNA synthetase
MKFYVTTPLYYVNDTPHIGHAYTTVVADVLTRYRKLFGDETYFLTGTDEHGQKVQKAAEKRGLDPQAHADEMVLNFKNIWKELEIKPDIFMRTTADFHKKVVQDCLQDLYDRGEIYIQEYEGWYSVSEEIFYTEKDLVDGKSPTGKEVQKVKEKNYFFKMSKYQDKLLEHIKNNPEFIQPEVRKNETLGFLAKPLEDLCISRPKARLSWGIEIPFDKDYVTYVWFDALLNYASAVGLKQPDKKKFFDETWPNAIHIIGKDILITHSIYWTTMLMALGIPLPKKIFAHGWWLTGNNSKMSKSEGEVVKPLDMKDIVGVDGLRYFLTRDISFGNDATFSQELVVQRVNTELANNLGNLVSRTTQLIAKYFEGKIPDIKIKSTPALDLLKLATAAPEKVKAEILHFAPQNAVGAVMDLLTDANKFLEAEAPWKKAKEDLNAAGESLVTVLEVLRIAGTLLHPVIPTKATELLNRIGYKGDLNFAQTKTAQVLKPGTEIIKADPLFPRIENK